MAIGEPVLEQMLFRTGKYMSMLRLVGSVIVFIGILQIIFSLAYMSDSWDAMNNFNHCTPEDASPCGEVLYRITGTSVWAGQTNLDVTQTISILIKPVVLLFEWIVVLLFGLWLYHFGQHCCREPKEFKSHKH